MQHPGETAANILTSAYIMTLSESQPEIPWVYWWWEQVIGFMHRPYNTPQDGIHMTDVAHELSMHAEFLRDIMADAQEHPSYGNRAGGIVKLA